MKIQKRIEDLDKEARLQLDEIIEDMESYIELPSNMSYQDELFTRIRKWQTNFYHQQILELIKDYGESLIGEDQGFLDSELVQDEYPEHIKNFNKLVEYRNELRQEMRAKLNGDIK